jgi:iron-sulfur cluster assembly protein
MRRRISTSAALIAASIEDPGKTLKTTRTRALQWLAMSEAQQPITLTDKAAGKIKELLGEQENGAEQALRVAVRGGGCSGFQYALAFDTPKEDDHRFENQGVAVVVDKTSMQFVFGSEVDWVDGLQGAGFAVNNPNVVAACGCGSSFQVKEDAAEQAAAV